MNRKSKINSIILKHVSFCSLLLFSCFSTSAQVKDIGQSFTKKGYILDIDFHNRLIIVNFILDKSISAELLRYDDKSTILKNKSAGSFDNLTPGTYVEVQGEYYPTYDMSQINKMTILTDKDQSFKTNEGRIDAIDGDFIYIDGAKIKLAAKGQITGKKGSGYEGKKFTSVKELKLGDLADAAGTWDASGFVLASKITAAPDLERSQDMQYREADELHNDLSQYWPDKVKRAALFGLPTPYGPITNSISIQNAVTDIGQSMVPDYIRQKINFIFVVVDNDTWNACAFPSGLVIINTGFLLTCENEAEFSAVIGHEITHAIYEHSASRIINSEKNEKSKNFFKLFTGLATRAIGLGVSNSNTTLADKVQTYQLDTSTAGVFLSQLPSAIFDKSRSNYSVANEAQADRVGLYLMVKAGYDPREAAKIWKKMYNTTASVSSGSSPFSLSTTDNILNNIYRMQQPSLGSIGQVLLNEAAKNKAKDLALESTQTHPENIDRFRQICEYIAMFWASGGQIQKYQTYQERWLNIMKTAYKELERSNWNSVYMQTEDPAKRLVLLDTALARKYEPKTFFLIEKVINNAYQDHYALVLKDCQAILKINPKSDTAYYYQAVAKWHLAKKAEAVTDMTNALKYNPKNVNAYYYRGYMYCQQKKYKEANKDFIKVLEFLPDNENVKELISVCQ